MNILTFALIIEMLFRNGWTGRLRLALHRLLLAQYDDTDESLSSRRCQARSSINRTFSRATVLLQPVRLHADYGHRIHRPCNESSLIELALTGGQLPVSSWERAGSSRSLPSVTDDQGSGRFSSGQSRRYVARAATAMIL